MIRFISNNFCLLLFSLLFVYLSPTFSAAVASEISVIKPSEEGFIQVDSAKLYYQSFGKGPLIILLHGGPGLDQTYLLPQMLELAKNYQLVLYDQRGSGKSSLHQIFSSDKINMPQFVNDLEALRKYLGHEQFVLMGHSFGGLLAMEYAILHQTHLSGLILLNPFPATSLGQQAYLTEYNNRLTSLKTNLDSILTSKAFLQGSSNSIIDFYRTLFSVYFYQPIHVEALSLNFNSMAAFSSFQITQIFMENYFMKENDLRSELKKLKIPTLIIAGSADIIPVWTAKEIADSIPKAKYVLIQESGHFPFIEKPSVLFATLNHFLKTLRYETTRKRVDEKINEN